jgi:purine-nucleoside phosphorylase
MDVMAQLREAIDFIRSKYQLKPSIGVVLGSGLGGFIDYVDVEHEIAYAEIPHFPVSTVEGHSGKLILGKIGDKQIVIMAGRFHFYEGYAPNEVVFPIRVMKLLGV